MTARSLVRSVVSCLRAAALAAVLVPELVAQNCDGVEPVSGEALTLALVQPLLNRPVDIASVPGDVRRLFIVEQRGQIRVLDLTTNIIKSTPFLSLSSRVSQTGNEQGLLGMTFHPRHAENGWFFVNYTRESDGKTVISRFQVSPENPDRAVASSEVIFFEIAQPFPNHNGGQLAFGPKDGYLYIALGDGGDQDDPNGYAQNPASLLGKLLRIDVDRPGDSTPYSIPPENPFVSELDVLPEIIAVGLRNPWRFSFDSLTGDLYIADVGQESREEIDFVPAALIGAQNFEWKVREGTRTANAGAVLTIGEPWPPIFEYSHTGTSGAVGCAAIGGIVYRGCVFPDLRGTYFFADYCADWVRSFRVIDGAASAHRDRTAELNFSIPTTGIGDIVAFGTDARGEIYICDLTGKLFRVVPRLENIPPTAAIRTEPSPPEVLLIDGNAEISLDSAPSDDGDGGAQPLSVTWEKVSGPAGDFINDSSAPKTTVVMTQAGNYTYKLTVDDGFATSSVEVNVLVVEVAPERFRRADSNSDSDVDISDGIATLRFLFLGGLVTCPDSADADDSGIVDLSDAVFTFNFLFLGGARPPSPGPNNCGPDASADLLAVCEEPPFCA
jgi:hypothetical protein